MDKLTALEQRIDEYRQQSHEAEIVALEKLKAYPQAAETLSPVEVLRRERLRHYTRSQILKEVQGWIQELRAAPPTDS
jgi:hypothetical protein